VIGKSPTAEDEERTEATGDVGAGVALDTGVGASVSGKEDRFTGVDTVKPRGDDISTTEGRKVDIVRAEEEGRTNDDDGSVTFAALVDDASEEEDVRTDKAVANRLERTL
jgi:hypothetical protein